MRFLELKIRDFRNIKSLDLDFTDGAPDRPLPLVVLAGPNGCGKTAVLEACLRLAHPTRYRAAMAERRPTKNDVRAGSTRAALSAMELLSPREADFVRREEFHNPNGSVANENPIRVGVTLCADTARVDLTPHHKSFHAEEAPHQPDVQPATIVYFDAERYTPRTRPLDSVKPSYEVSPSPGFSASWPDLRQWTKEQIVALKFGQLLEREQEGNLGRAADGRSVSDFDRLWEPIHRVFAIRFREITRDLRILFDTPSGPVEFDDLSSGERAVILLFTDLILRRVSESTILIDEPEHHLHPSWQMKILPALRELLPDCQIIVATQSPFVVASVREAKYVFKLGELDLEGSHGH